MLPFPKLLDMVYLGIGLGIYALALVVACLVSLWPPRVPLFFSPGAADVPQEDVRVLSNGRELPGWWVPASGPTWVAVLCHGYLMNRSELSPLAVWLCHRGIPSLSFDFPGHGRSPRALCGFGVREADDVWEAVALAKAKAPGARVILLGSSMGSGACVLALARDPKLADALVVDSGYSRLWVAALCWWRFLGGRLLQVAMAPTVVIAMPIARINPFRVDLSRALSSLGELPVLLFHGDRDTLVPPSEAERNARSCGGRIVWFEGCGHAEGRWVYPEKYHAELQAFLRELGAIDGSTASERP